jgi:hypothetical protein
MDLKDIRYEVTGYIFLAQNWGKWQDPVKIEMNIRVLKKAGNLERFER